MKGRMILLVLAFALVINLPMVYGQLSGLDDRDDRLSTRHNVGLPVYEDGDEDEDVDLPIVVEALCQLYSIVEAPLPVAVCGTCFADEDCGDGNICTSDSCQNSGTPNAGCVAVPVTGLFCCGLIESVAVPNCGDDGPLIQCVDGVLVSDPCPPPPCGESFPVCNGACGYDEICAHISTPDSPCMCVGDDHGD